MLGIWTYETKLKPVLSLYSKIANIKKVSECETVCYDATYVAKTDELIATIPYEVMTLLSNRIAKVYTTGNDQVSIVNQRC